MDKVERLEMRLKMVVGVLLGMGLGLGLVGVTLDVMDWKQQNESPFEMVSIEMPLCEDAPEVTCWDGERVIPEVEAAPEIAHRAILGVQMCLSEDSDGPCYWDAQQQGNGVGKSFFVSEDGTVTYLP